MRHKMYVTSTAAGTKHDAQGNVHPRVMKNPVSRK